MDGSRISLWEDCDVDELMKISGAEVDLYGQRQRSV